jgi:hypothetical protein
MPEQDAVLAITADTGNMQNEVNVVWDTLLPAFQQNPLPANPAEEAKLKQAVSNLVAPPKPATKPAATKPVAAQAN